jgi:hypothetical protein
VKKLLLLALLAGCATTETERYATATAALLCEVRTCPDFAAAHGYQLFLVRARGDQCVCRLMSPYSPDMFNVTLPNAK